MSASDEELGTLNQAAELLRRELGAVTPAGSAAIRHYGEEINTARSAVADLVAAAAAVHSARSLDRIAAALERLAPPGGEQARKDTDTMTDTTTEATR